MSAIMQQFFRIPLARDTDHKPEPPIAPALTPEMASSTTTARVGSTPNSFAAIKYVSGAGLPARCWAWIVLPSTCTLKNVFNLAAFSRPCSFDSR